MPDEATVYEQADHLGVRLDAIRVNQFFPWYCLNYLFIKFHLNYRYILAAFIMQRLFQVRPLWIAKVNLFLVSKMNFLTRVIFKHLT